MYFKNPGERTAGKGRQGWETISPRSLQLPLSRLNQVQNPQRREADISAH